MTKILAILDSQEQYVKSFMQYISMRNRFGLEVQAFTKEKKLREFLETNKVEILLLSCIEFENYAIWEKEIKEERIKKLILLTEEQEERKDYPTIYRYQSMKKLIQNIFAYYREEELGEKIIEKEEKCLIGVYSPIKRCFKTIFSLLLGRALSEENRVLYLNLEEYSGFEEIFKKNYSFNLADLLYEWKEEKDWLKTMETEMERWGNVCYIPPVKCPADIKDITAKEWKEWLGILLKKSSFSYIICDFGNGFPNIEQVLELCEAIYMPIRNDEIAKAKVNEYEAYLSSLGFEDIKERIIKLHLPSPMQIEFGVAGLEELYQGELLDTVKEIKRDWENRKVGEREKEI